MTVDVGVCMVPSRKQKDQTMTTSKSTETSTTTTRRTRTPSAKKPFTVYFAGDLWTHKDLIGNSLLGEFIRKISRGRYECILPQDLEEPVHRTVDIRNLDLKHVMTCDMAIFNFVEFMYAKMLDVPCLILRTDFRSAGEGGQDQDPWNLMATHWPRTEVLKLHGMVEYQTSKDKARHGAAALAATIKTLYRKLASQVVDGLDRVRQQSPLITDPQQLRTIYNWAVQCPGSGYPDLFADTEVSALLDRKVKKGLLAD
jgi:hypothetical protein